MKSTVDSTIGCESCGMEVETTTQQDYDNNPVELCDICTDQLVLDDGYEDEDDSYDQWLYYNGGNK